jgi:membrane protein implicated in regulation of membrane protease activity
MTRFKPPMKKEMSELKKFLYGILIFLFGAFAFYLSYDVLIEPILLWLNNWWYKLGLLAAVSIILVYVLKKKLPYSGNFS